MEELDMKKTLTVTAGLVGTVLLTSAAYAVNIQVKASIPSVCTIVNGVGSSTFSAVNLNELSSTGELINNTDTKLSVNCNGLNHESPGSLTFAFRFSPHAKPLIQ